MYVAARGGNRVYVRSVHDFSQFSIVTAHILIDSLARRSFLIKREVGKRNGDAPWKEKPQACEGICKRRGS
jgi:hypothetical protein